MAEQYWIGDFFIDLSRNQITQNNQPQIIPPKALAVLTFLAENQGKVVSQDALLAKVWPNTIVSPNTLQRSIAQLRKALGDDGKEQVYIKTHAKQGYSLECEVRWQADTKAINSDDLASAPPYVVEKTNHEPVQADSQMLTQTRPSKWQLKTLIIIFAIFTIALMSSRYFTTNKPVKVSVGEIRALTASDDNEFASIYSPDGQYIIFHRYSLEECVNNIWAKNLLTQQEHQLTKNIDSYGSHSFSKDGKQLVFIRTLNCEQPTTQKKCYQLMSLDFHQALNSPQAMRVLLECKHSEIRMPHWLNNHNIALLQKQSERWQLISYSISENKSQVLHKVNDGNIIYFDYSPHDNLIAAISIKRDGNYYIEMLTPDGKLLSSNKINYPQEIARHRFIYANFSPFENQLIFSTGRQLFTLSYDGEINNISLPLDQPIGSPYFHPKGDRALVIKGNYDSDISSVPLSQLSQAKTLSENSKILQRSIVADGNAIAQPNGKLIAFTSERSGEEQIWLTDGQEARQLSHFPMDTYIYGINWAADGNSLLANTNDTLVQINLNASQQTYPLPHPVVELLQWESNNNSALLLMRINGIVKLAEVNLANGEINILTDKKVNWAAISENGQLIYSDHIDRFWRAGPLEHQPITALDGQGGDNQKFLLKNNIIYGINNEYQLWSFNLKEDDFNIVGQLPKNVDYLSDIDKNQLLMTVRISSRKEVVELTLSK